METIGLYQEFNRQLYRQGSEQQSTLFLQPETQTLTTNIFGGSDASTLQSSKLLGNLSIAEGFLKSENFVSGSAGWQLTPTSAELNVSTAIASLDIPDTTTANSWHVNATGNMWQGATTYAAAPAQYSNTGNITITGTLTASNVAITGGSITTTPISAIPNSTATDISLLEFSHNLVFSVTDLDTIAWAAGTIVMSNGRTFSIDAGNTGNMSALTYIYLDTAVSSTVLQTTTTYSTAMGANRALIGTAQNNTVTASFIPRGGGQPLIDGGNIGALSIVAGNIAASTITSDKISVSQLSAISADIGTITAGSISVVNGANTIGFTPAGVNAIFSGPTGSPTFRVTPAGAMTATSGTFGAWTISGNTFTTTASNMLVGTSAGAAITSGTDNVLLGTRAGDAITSGSTNIFIGVDAGGAAISATGSVFIGYQAGILTTDSSNIFIGYQSGSTNAGSGGNTFVGYQSGLLTTSGDNTFVGYTAGDTITSGAQNIAIGSTTDFTSATIASSIVIGYAINATANQQCVIGHTSGITNFYFGRGVTNAAPQAITLRNTSASGTDIAGGNLTISSGQSTGLGAGSSLILQTSPTGGGSGSSLNAPVTGLTISSSQVVTLANALPFASGGTGIASWTQYLIPYAATTTSIGQIAIGTSGQVLTSNGAGAAPTFQTPTTVTYKNGTATRAGNTASGSQTIAHGLGATPSKVRITARWSSGAGIESFSEGVYDGTTTSCIYTNTTTSQVANVSSTRMVSLLQTTFEGLDQSATIAVDATNITLTWTRNGATNAATMYLMWEVE